jgi:hypothetical protein
MVQEIPKLSKTALANFRTRLTFWTRRVIIQVQVQTDYTSQLTGSILRHPTFHWRDLTSSDLTTNPKFLEILTRKLK